MTIFERELIKCSEAFSERKFIGRSMYIPLDKGSHLKMQFINTGDNRLGGIRLTVLDKESGEIDREIIRFEDIWGMKINISTGLSAPFMWTFNGKTEWNGYQPTMKDFKLIEEKVVTYAELYMEQEQTQGMSMTQQM